MSKKISANYWQQLKPIEQEYIKQRVNLEDIPSLKMKIKEARKQHPEFTRIYGKGFIDLPNGQTLLFTGEDTRRFIKI